MRDFTNNKVIAKLFVITAVKATKIFVVLSRQLTLLPDESQDVVWVY